MADDQIKKEKKWLFFAIGLMSGFAICLLTFVIFSMIQNKTRSFTQTIEHIYKQDNTKDTIVKYVNVTRAETAKENSVKKTEYADSLMVEDVDETFDEVDFSYAEEDEPANDDVVVEDKILAQKRVRVQCKDADFKDIATMEGVDDFFVVQQWNTPIKNRITYHRLGNMLQVKGINVEKVELVYYDQQYYLLYNGNHYLLKNNDTYEKLGAPLAMDSQK